MKVVILAAGLILLMPIVIYSQCIGSGCPGTSGGGGGSGTVTQINTSGPIIGGPITATGTLDCPTCGLTSNPLSQFATTTSLQLLGLMSDETGTGMLVFQNTPTLITPILGVATVTSINKVTITQPATSAILTILDGKTFTVNNTLTIASTDGITMTTPTTSFTAARTDAANIFTGIQTLSSVLTPAGISLIVASNISSTASKFGIGLANNGTVRAPTTGAASQHLLNFGTFGPASGAINFHLFENQWTINQTSTASGVTRGYYDNPVFTSVYDYRAFETAGGTINLLSNTPTEYQQIYLNPYTYASGSSKTPTNASTLRIAGPPADGTNVTTSNKYAIKVDSGAVRLDGTIIYTNGAGAANTVACYKAGGVMGWASNSAGVIGTTCN